MSITPSENSGTLSLGLGARFRTLIPAKLRFLLLVGGTLSVSYWLGDALTPYVSPSYSYLSMAKLAVAFTACLPVFYWFLYRPAAMRISLEALSRTNEAQLKTLVASSKHALVAIDFRGRISIFNPAAEEMFGWRAEEMLGKDLTPLIPEEYRERHEKYLMEFFRGAEMRRELGRTVEFPALRRDGSQFPVELTLSSGRTHSRPFVYAAMLDISERKRAQEELTRIRSAVNDASDAIVICDPERRAVFLNEAFKEKFGLSLAEIQTAGLDVIFSRVGESRALFDSVEKGINRSFEVVLCPTHRSIFPALLRATAILGADQALTGTLILITDISERKRLEEELRRTCRQDPLTGIANRRLFDEQMQLEWNRAIRNDRPLALLMVDVDSFKAFNDCYGHVAGDKCLRRVATVLSGRARRAEDFVARYGGEEFAVILPGTDLHTAERIGEAMRVSIEDLGISHEHSDTAKVVTASIGVSVVVPRKGHSPEELINEADSALYEAKDAGRNCLRIGTAPPANPDASPPRLAGRRDLL